MLFGRDIRSFASARARTALYTWKSNDKIAFIHHYQVRWVCFGSAHVAAIMYTRVLYVRECDLFENFCNWKVFFVHFPTFFSFGSTVIFQPLYTHYDEMIYMHCTTIYISRTTSMFDVLVSYITLRCAHTFHSFNQNSYAEQCTHRYSFRLLLQCAVRLFISRQSVRSDASEWAPGFRFKMLKII